MTEQEWLGCSEPEEMITFLRIRSDPLTVRNSRLFCCACCRRIWHLLFPEARSAVEIAERHADGLATDGELRSADFTAARTVQYAAEEDLRTHGPLMKYCDDAVGSCCRLDGPEKSVTAQYAVLALDPELQLSPASPDSGETADVTRYRAEPVAQCDLLREVYGNPFRPVLLDPAWRTSVVVSLARAAYDDRILPEGTLDPDRLGVLADALEDAGCDSASILGHLRGPGPHVRGCWALDLLLGKK
jgi:hypothetical protein